MRARFAFVCALALLAPLLRANVASAGTTGTLSGQVLDADSKVGIAGAVVSVASPSQTAQTSTDATGRFRFLSLAPDTYVVGVSVAGYDSLSTSGVNVLADQGQTLSLPLRRALKTIARLQTRSSSDLVKPGTTSDVYSVNPATAEAAQALGGPGGLNNAYSAISSVPGVVVQQGQQGWYQTLSIRGGDIDQVGYELDGIPANRVYDNAPQTMLSNLGQQELQVYTGGTPASAEASGIAGYVNQVIRSGTYPGFVTGDIGIGGPAFYHKASLEFGGATKDRLFSYYVGIAGANQNFRYYDNFNGSSDPQFFYPVYFPEGHFNFYDGTPGPLNFAPGNAYSIAFNTDRENVINLHFGIPHKNGTLRDDVQLLYLTSEQVEYLAGSVNDQGGPANVVNAVGNNGNAYWHDGWVYTGKLFAAPVSSDVVPYYFPNSPQNRPFEANLSNDARDYSDNGVAISKVQYQHNIDARSYLRAYGYTEYSNWFIGGPGNQNFTGYYGAELNDYELPSHTYGFNLTYANQLDDHNLVTATGSYTAAQVQRRYSYGFPGNTLGYPITNLIDSAGYCYDAATATQTSCYSTSPTARGTLPASPPQAAVPPLASGTVAVVGPGGPTNAQWLVTDNGFASSRLNQVSPVFSAVSFADQLHPTDRLTINAGLRLENYDDRLADTSGGPARAFWFSAYNNEHCYKLGGLSPVTVPIGGTDPVSGMPITGSSAAVCQDLYGAGYRPANLVNQQGTSIDNAVVEPRLSFTYTVSPDTVLRGSYGIYARPVNTSWLQYGAVNTDLASFIGANFLTLGYNTPIHQLKPDTSNNLDFSLEQNLPGTGISFKVTPFYRATQDQLQPVPIGAGGVVSGFNVGQQTSDGVEVAVRRGDFARNGLAVQLAYTYTHSRIKYNNFPSGTNVIDNINQYIADYNSYTSACATITRANAKLCGLPAGSSNPNAVAVTGGVANPYYNAPAQPLFDRNGSYTTYDEIPQPFTGENGYETPDVASLIVSYRHERLRLTPSLTYSSGAYYGSPLSTPGYVPSGCQTTPGTTAAIPYTCSGTSAVTGNSFLLIPDQYTGKFDNLGAFQEPSRLTLNFAASYDLTQSVKLTGTATGLVDTCFQRGYAWDDPHICVYSQLPSGGAGLGPTGNFLPASKTPIQYRYPYAVFNNNLNTGFVGTTLPINFTLNATIRL